MPIPASLTVQVVPRLISPGGNDLEFNALFLTSNADIPTSQYVLQFGAPEDVGAYFGLSSDEFRLASRYFQGYDSSFAKPSKLYFAPLAASAMSAFVRGGKSGALADIQLITSGTINITFGEYTAELDSLDFSAATSMSAVANIIQTALQAYQISGSVPDEFATATVVYSSVFAAFVITSGVAGEDTNVAFPTGSIVDLLALTESTGAVLSPGCEYTAPEENMAKICTKTQNFVTFMSVNALDAAQTVAYAGWAASKGVDYLFVYWDDDPTNTTQSPVGTISQALADANAGACAGIYGGAEYAAFLCSVASCINYNRAGGAITFKFKKQAGLPALVHDATTANNLDALNLNYIGDNATRNDDFVFLAQGKMFGDWVWIDTYLNAVFLNNAIQTACMAGLTQSSRVPFTESGYTQVRAWIQDPVTRGLRAGVIETGVAINELQRTQLMRETGGIDISSYLINDGYYIMVHEADAAVRQARGPLSVSLWYAYGGAVHRLIVDSSAVV